MIGNFMIDFLKDHHESDTNNIIIKLLTIFIATMAEMTQCFAAFQFNLWLEISHILWSQATYALLL